MCSLRERTRSRAASNARWIARAGVEHLLTETGRLTFQAEDTSVTLAQAKAGHVPAGSEIYKFSHPTNWGETEILLKQRPVLTGGDVRDLTVEEDEFGRPAVNFS